MYLQIYNQDDNAASQDNHDDINLSDDAVFCVLSYLGFMTVDQSSQVPSALPCMAGPQNALVVENAPRVQAGGPL